MRQDFLKAGCMLCIFLGVMAYSQDIFAQYVKIPKDKMPIKMQEPAHAKGEEVQLNGITKSSQEFSFDLYRQLAKEVKENENLFFSPTSIHVTLAMTAAGAENNTKKQMQDVLHLANFGKKEYSGFADLMKSLTAPSEEYQLSLANRLWGEKQYTFLPEYLDVAKTSFLAPLESMDFSGNPEKSRKVINAWVEEQTQEKIKDLLKPGVINSATRLVLTNAVYFKGSWVSGFKKELTAEHPFRTEETLSASSEDKKNVKKVPLMYQKAKFPIYVAEDFQAISLPYKGDRLEMIVILPNKVNGLPDLEAQLSPEFFQNILRNLSRKEVKLWLAKFKLEESFELNEILGKMGMTDAFSSARADFSGMTGNRDLYLSAVVHKSFVDVNEEGTEAAAATAGIMMMRSMPRPQQEIIFKTDHPFLFGIRDTQTGELLFFGRVVNP
ncbi:MAG: serpin family protein [Planctomycetia bacterium]|nr:serpin family protein [Planctomycetia bacterium]